MEDRYYDLKEIVDKLSFLVDELQDTDLINTFQGLLDEYEQELEEAEEIMQREADEELKRREKEYWADQF